MDQSRLKTILQTLKGWPEAVIGFWASPVWGFLFAAAVYIGLAYASGRLSGPSETPHFNYLADAFLHGQVWLRQVPVNPDDLILFQGKYSLYQSPFPALLVAPLVMVFGLDANDVVLTAVVGAINAGLVAALLRSAVRTGLINLSITKRGLMVFFFTVGTVHITQAAQGNVWALALVIGFTCTALAYLAAISLQGWKAWLFTGLALSCAMLTRNHLVFTGIFPLIYLLSKEKPWQWTRGIGRMLIAGAPLVAGLGFWLLYNQVRFGNPFDNGLAYHQMAPFFRPSYDQYGAFNLHYLPANLYYQFIHYPLPMRDNSYMGGSLFLMSPLFFGAFAAIVKPRLRLTVIGLTASILVTYIPIGLLMGTGWIQFGPRYTLDFTVPMLLLTAIGIERWRTWLVVLLALISGLTYIIGIPHWQFL